MTEESNELVNQQVEGVEEKDMPKATHNRRKFAQNLATALGLTAVVAGTSVASGNPDSKVKSRILEQIQKDLADRAMGADCYDRGPAGDHYLKGDCPGPILPSESVDIK